MISMEKNKFSFLKGNNCRFLSFLEGKFVSLQPSVGIYILTIK